MATKTIIEPINIKNKKQALRIIRMKAQISNTFENYEEEAHKKVNEVDLAREELYFELKGKGEFEKQLGLVLASMLKDIGFKLDNKQRTQSDYRVFITRKGCLAYKLYQGKNSHELDILNKTLLKNVIPETPEKYFDLLDKIKRLYEKKSELKKDIEQYEEEIKIGVELEIESADYTLKRSNKMQTATKFVTKMAFLKSSYFTAGCDKQLVVKYKNYENAEEDEETTINNAKVLIYPEIRQQLNKLIDKQKKFIKKIDNKKKKIQNELLKMLPPEHLAFSMIMELTS